MPITFFLRSWLNVIIYIFVFSVAAYFNDIAVGAVCCRVDHSQNQKRLYIMTLGCLAPYRRLGIGKIMWCFVLSGVVEYVFNLLYLWVIEWGQPGLNWEALFQKTNQKGGGGLGSGLWKVKWKPLLSIHLEAHRFDLFTSLELFHSYIWIWEKVL